MCVDKAGQGKRAGVCRRRRPAARCAPDTLWAASKKWGNGKGQSAPASIPCATASKPGERGPPTGRGAGGCPLPRRPARAGPPSPPPPRHAHRRDRVAAPPRPPRHPPPRPTPVGASRRGSRRRRASRAPRAGDHPAAGVPTAAPVAAAAPAALRHRALPCSAAPRRRRLAGRATRPDRRTGHKINTRTDWLTHARRSAGAVWGRVVHDEAVLCTRRVRVFHAPPKDDIRHAGLPPGLAVGTPLARVVDVYGGGPVGEGHRRRLAGGTASRLNVRATAAVGAAVAVTTTGVAAAGARPGGAGGGAVPAAGQTTAPR